MAIENKYKAKDAELFAEVQKIKDGTSQNYNRLYELSEKYIYKIINDIVKNHHTTEDLMQEAYIQIYNKLDTLQEAKAFYVWAGRIATNLTLRYIQKNSKEVLVTADEEGETNFIFDKATDDTEEFIPEAVLVDKEKQRLLAEIIDNLSTEQKFCVQYFYYEEMSVNEIAELMGCSAGTVKSRLNYARKSIKDAVIELDVKHGTRLYSLSALPLFWIIFREGLELLVLSGSAVGAAATVGAASAAEATGGAGMASAAGGASSVQSASAVGAGSVKASATVSGASEVTSTSVGNSTLSGVSKVVETVKTKTVECGKALVTDVKKSVESAKQILKTEKEAVKLAGSEGKKEAIKAVGQSVINIGKETGKGFMAWELSSKIITIIIVIVIVITSNIGRTIIYPPVPPMEEPPIDEIIEEPYMESEVVVESVEEESKQEEEEPQKEIKLLGDLDFGIEVKQREGEALLYKVPCDSAVSPETQWVDIPMIDYWYNDISTEEVLYDAEVDEVNVLSEETQQLLLSLAETIWEEYWIYIEDEEINEYTLMDNYWFDIPWDEVERILGTRQFTVNLNGVEYCWHINRISGCMFKNHNYIVDEKDHSVDLDYIEYSRYINMYGITVIEKQESK